MLRVCIILEGCYPFVRGGVSTWIHQYLAQSPDIEFVLWTIHASKDDVKTPLYQFPENVKEHHMLILDEGMPRKKYSYNKLTDDTRFTDAVYRLATGKGGSFEYLVEMIRDKSIPPESLIKTEAFLEVARHLSNEISGLGLADAFYNLQSMFLPIFKVLSADVPTADIYHSAVTGYGGMLGAMASIVTHKPLILTEHGIYPREREEELISSDWTVKPMRHLWIKMFYEMSKFAYKHATKVTSLFDDARERQIKIGCEPSKCVVIPNGIDITRFKDIPVPVSSSEVHIGAFVRFAAIKDIKTMILAFAYARQKEQNLTLHIMGGTDDQDYRQSCETLINRLDLNDCVRIEGHVDTVQFMEMMHVTILTSISEGQPLTILESMAAGRPCIATRVGNCVGLIEDEILGIGAAGVCCTPMSPNAIAAAILKLCSDEELRMRMSRNGKARINTRYLLQNMLDSYHSVYQEVK